MSSRISNRCFAEALATPSVNRRTVTIFTTVEFKRRAEGRRPLFASPDIAAVRLWLNAFLDSRRTLLVKQPSGFSRCTLLAKRRRPRIAIGVGIRALPFHYTLGMGRTAVWATALHQGLKLRSVPIFPLSISISFT